MWPICTYLTFGVFVALFYLRIEVDLRRHYTSKSSQLSMRSLLWRRTGSGCVCARQVGLQVSHGVLDVLGFGRQRSDLMPARAGATDRTGQKGHARGGTSKELLSDVHQLK